MSPREHSGAYKRLVIFIIGILLGIDYFAWNVSVRHGAKILRRCLFLCFCLCDCSPLIPPRRDSIVTVQYGSRTSTNQRQAPARIGVWLAAFCRVHFAESISGLCHSTGNTPSDVIVDGGDYTALPDSLFIRWRHFAVTTEQVYRVHCRTQSSVTFYFVSVVRRRLITIYMEVKSAAYRLVRCRRAHTF
jgi:hypothetical protein